MPATQLDFSTVALLEALQQAPIAETFLNATFFPQTRFFVGRFCQVDTRKARRLLAPVVKRGQPGRVVSREPLATNFFEVPEIRPVRVTTVADLEERTAGESGYSRRTPDERFAEILASDQIELINSTVRRIEKMSSDLLFSGAISYLLDSGDVETLDYGVVTPVVP